VWAGCRGDDLRWPCYLEQRQAVNWMRDRLSRAPGLIHASERGDDRSPDMAQVRAAFGCCAERPLSPVAY
jgi:hypothetical protein